MASKIILSAISFIIVIVSGILMSRLGKPYQAVLFNIHKLISLAAIVLAAIALNNFRKASGLSSQQLTLVIAIAIFVLATLATGGIISAKEEPAKIILMIHKIMPVLIVIGLTTFLIILKKVS